MHAGKSSRIFTDKIREFITRALSGESVIVFTRDKSKYKAAIKFLDIDDQLVIMENKTSLTVKLKTKTND